MKPKEEGDYSLLDRLWLKSNLSRRMKCVVAAAVAFGSIVAIAFLAQMEYLDLNMIIGQHSTAQPIPQPIDLTSDYYEGKARFKTNSGMVGFADESGNVVIQPRYDFALFFNHGRVIVKYQGEWGVIDCNESWLLGPGVTFEEAQQYMQE